jgi:hypothetical protein
MRFSIPVTLLISATTALAGPHDELASARQRVHAESTRVSYYEKQTIIAERDIATARIHRDTATKAKAQAVRENDNAAASVWARRHDEALTAEREAQARAERNRQERDRAHDDLQASTTRVRQLERGTRASR